MKLSQIKKEIAAVYELEFTTPQVINRAFDLLQAVEAHQGKLEAYQDTLQTIHDLAKARAEEMGIYN